MKHFSGKIAIRTVLIVILPAVFITFIKFIFAAPLGAQEKMTVEDAIKLGLKNNYDIQIARHDAAIATNNKGRGTAGFLPIIDTSGTYQYSSANPETGAPLRFGNRDNRNTRSARTQISLNWTLFDGFRMFANRRRYNELAKLGKDQTRNIIESTVVAIMRAYFNLVQQEQLLEVAENTRDISATRLNREQVRRDLGGVSSTDLLDAKVAFNNDQATLLNQEQRVVIARKDLNILLAQDPADPVTVIKEITILPLQKNLAKLKSLAAKHNSTLKVARQNKIVADENVNLAESAFYPRLMLNGNYVYSDRKTYGNLSTGSFASFSVSGKTRSVDSNIGLILAFNLFNGNLNKIDYQNARIEAKNQELALRNIQNRLAGLVQEKHVTFQKKVATAKLEEENVVAARQNLELQKERYATGAITSIEFRDAQVNLVRARTTLIVATFQARIALLEIQQLIGNIAI